MTAGVGAATVTATIGAAVSLTAKSFPSLKSITFNLLENTAILTDSSGVFSIVDLGAVTTISCVVATRTFTIS